MQHLTMDTDTELGLLRHYMSVPQAYLHSLLGQEYRTLDFAQEAMITKWVSTADVAHALETPGPKFYSNLGGLQTPRKLMELIRARAMNAARTDELHWFDGEFAKKAYLTVKFPDPIGVSGIVPVQSLPEDVRATIVRRPRGKLAGEDFLVNTIANYPEQPTNRIAAVIGWVKDDPAPTLFDAYPGGLIPDHPSDLQGLEERAYNFCFWEKHAVIVR